VSVVVAQDAAEALPTKHRTAPVPDLAWGSRKPRRPAGSTQQGPVVMYGNEPTRHGCSDGAIRRPGGCPLPGWRAGAARAGGRSSWRTRCGCGDKHSFGPGRRAVKRQNVPISKEPQAPSSWAFAVGLSILTLRGLAERSYATQLTPARAPSPLRGRAGVQAAGRAYHRAASTRIGCPYLPSRRTARPTGACPTQAFSFT
jgi:hypothetical protein